MDKADMIRAVGAVFGALGVFAGAFGAHALKGRLQARGSVGTWDTAVRYQLVHALALVLLGMLTPYAAVNATTLAFVAFSGGIVFFSGSLYGLALGGPRWLGPVTPIGGIALILGWIFLGAA